MEQMIWAVGVFAGLGLLLGLLLAIASKVFAVKTDERIPRILECLPGANCGGCGYAGCEAMAQAMVAGNAPADGCPVCDAGAKEEIANILGISASPTSPQHAQVLCRGTVQAAKKKFAYEGIHDCIAAAKLFGGDKQCAYGCLGYGTCVSACSFHAIVLQDGVAVVKEQDCRSCGVCVNVCPKHLFELLPADTAIFVGCRAKDRGAQTRQNCTVGCIGCKRCEKVCPTNAIKVQDNVAVIAQDKCTRCGACADACPQHCISTPQMRKEAHASISPQ